MTKTIMPLRDAGTYGKNLWGIGLILSGVFLLIEPSFFSFLAILGGFFISEHIWNWGVFEFYDFIGHEWLGLLFIVISFFFNIGWISLIGLIFVLMGISLNLYTGKDSLSKELKEE